VPLNQNKRMSNCPSVRHKRKLTTITGGIIAVPPRLHVASSVGSVIDFLGPSNLLLLHLGDVFREIGRIKRDSLFQKTNKADDPDCYDRNNRLDRSCP